MIDKSKVKSQKSKRNSFTLVEVLIAVSILVLLIGAMGMIEASNIKMASSGKHQLQATGLARSALNLVRTIRDTNLLTNNADGAFAGLATSTTDYQLTNNSCKHGDGTEYHPCGIDGGARGLWGLSSYSLNDVNNKVTLNGTEYTIKIKIE